MLKLFGGKGDKKKPEKDQKKAAEADQLSKDKEKNAQVRSLIKNLP